MSGNFNYRFYFDLAIQMAKAARLPVAGKHEWKNYRRDELIENKLFDFEDTSFNQCVDVMDVVRQHSDECIEIIIKQLLKARDYKFKVINKKVQNVLFSIYDEEKKNYFYFIM